jgi:hypothetical protein
MLYAVNTYHFSQLKITKMNLYWDVLGNNNGNKRKREVLAERFKKKDANVNAGGWRCFSIQPYPRATLPPSAPGYCHIPTYRDWGCSPRCQEGGEERERTALTVLLEMGWPPREKSVTFVCWFSFRPMHAHRWPPTVAWEVERGPASDT